MLSAIASRMQFLCLTFITWPVINYESWLSWKFVGKSQAFDKTFDKNSNQENPCDSVNSFPILFLWVMITYQNIDSRKTRDLKFWWREGLVMWIDSWAAERLPLWLVKNSLDKSGLLLSATYLSSVDNTILWRNLLETILLVKQKLLLKFLYAFCENFLEDKLLI